MALQSAVLCPAQNQRPTIISPTAGASSAEVAVPSRLVVFTTDSDVFIRVGVTGMSAASTSDFPLWAKTYVTFDFGIFNNTAPFVRVFNNGGSTANVYLMPLSQN
jgi:hypothetical protein